MKRISIPTINTELKIKYPNSLLPTLSIVLVFYFRSNTRVRVLIVLKQATRVRDFEFNISIATIVYCNHSDPGYYESKRLSKALLQIDLLSPKSFDVLLTSMYRIAGYFIIISRT